MVIRHRGVGVMSRQRAQYLRRAIPRLKAKRAPKWIITGPLPESDLDELRRRFCAAMRGPAQWLPAEPLPPIGWPDHWGEPKPYASFWEAVRPPRGFWRSLFGR